MNYFFSQLEKIEQYEKIQKNLLSLDPNTDDDQIKKLIDHIPKNFLRNKEDLMIICELFAIYARIRNKTKKRNVFKLFEGIMNSIKIYLQDQSKFFWNILGGLFYLKLWMYQNGLISIDTIILSAKKDKNHSIAEYFLPEIIENDPEIFEKEIKYQINCPYSDEYLNQFKEKRQKYLNWLCESGDFFDPLYKEIETDPLLYSLVTDDVDTFQKIVTNSNLDINSRIKESLIQNSHRVYNDETLLEFALEYNAIKISKFLIMNDAELTNGLYYSAITCYDLDMIHLLETKIPNNFAEYMMCNAVSDWNDEIVDYILNKYDEYDFLDKKVDSDFKNKKYIIEMIQNTFTYLNFGLLKSKIIPFLNNNNEFVNENIYEILKLTFGELSGYFAKEFLKNSNIDINHYNDHFSVLGRAIDNENANVIEFLLMNKQIDVNKDAFNKFPPLMFACGNYADMKIIKLIANHPDVNVNLRDGRYDVNAFEISVSRGNLYATQYLIENYSKIETRSYSILLQFSLKKRYLKTLKVILKHYFEIEQNVEYEKLIKSIKDKDFNNELKDDYFDDFKIIFDEILQ